MSLETLRAAEEYIDRGFALIPLELKSKMPNFPVLESVYKNRGWKHLEESPASLKDIKSWLSYDPKTNIGIISGRASNLVVIDFDESDTNIDLPTVPEVKTYRGKHLFFSASNVDFSLTKHSLKGEIRGNSHYTFAPPSYHETGYQYHWRVSLNDAPLADWNSFKGHSLITQAFASCRQGRVSTTSYPYISKANNTPISPYCEPSSLGCFTGVLEIVAQWLGIAPRFSDTHSSSFRCILPGHEETRPSANFFRHPVSGLWIYKDHHHDGTCYTLADLRASLAAGRALKLKQKPTCLYWYGRLFADCWIIEPARIAIQTPTCCSEATQRAADGLSLLMGIRALLNTGETIPFSPSFASIWCGITKKQHQIAMRQLEGWGSIKREGSYKQDNV